MIDARGLSCPEPVIQIKKAMASKEKEYEMLVDNVTALENVTRFAQHSGYEVEHTWEGSDYRLRIFRK